MIRATNFGGALRRVGLICACLLGFGLSIVASADDDALARARTLVGNGDAEGAYALLKPLEAERAGEPAFDYLLGISALDSGRPTEAVFALERVLAVEPGNALARAEIARAHLKLGERETARRELETVRARSDIPDDAKEAIERYLVAFRASAGDAITWRAFISATLGYDTNVNSATSDDTIGLLGSAFNLDPSAQDRSDWFGRLGAGANVSVPVGANSAMIGGVTASTRINKDERDFDQASISSYGGLDVRHGNWTYTGVLQYGTFRLDREAYRNAFGGTFQARRPLDSVSEVTGYAQVSRLTYQSQAIRNAYRYVLGGGYSRALGGARNPIVFAGAFGAVEDEIADNVEHLGHAGFGVTLGGEMEVFDDARLFASGGYEKRNYGGQEPLFGRSRRDERFSLLVGLDYEPYDDWVVSPLVRLVRNNSNIPVNDYDRAIVEMTVRRDFGN